MRATAEYPYVFPPLWFYAKAFSVDVFFLADNFKVPKRPRINRYCVAGTAGELRLTVPVHRPHGWSSRINELRVVADAHWRAAHLRTLANDYAMAPYLDYYWDELKALYDEASVCFFDFARRTILWIADKLKLAHVKWELLSEYSGGRVGAEALGFACAKIGAGLYIQFADHYDVKDKRLLEGVGVSVEHIARPRLEYRNLAGIGSSDLSALDFLLNYGPEASLRLKQAVGRVVEF